MIKQYDLLLLGGSAFACGVQLGAEKYFSKKSAIIASGIVLAPEFALSLYRVEKGQTFTALGNELQAELKKREIIQGEKIHLPPASDVLAKRMLEQDMTLFLNSVVTDIRQKAGEYLVTIWTVEGFRVISARKILDTTPLGWNGCNAERVTSTIVCGSMYGEGAFFTGDIPSVRCVAGAMEGEAILQIELPFFVEEQTAKRRLHELWRSLKSKNPSYFMVAECESLAYQYTFRGGIKQDNDVLWIPSGQYASFLQAFDAGVQWAEEQLKCDI